MSDVYQSGIGRWISGVWRIIPCQKYEYQLWPELRTITKELPGDRYMDEEIVGFAYRYTTEDAIRRLEEVSSRDE